MDIQFFTVDPMMKVALAGAVLVSGIFLYAVAPGGAWYPRCPLNLWTGLFCPGCGSMRALHALLNGHVRAAFAYNPAMIIALPLLAAPLVATRESRLNRPLPAWLVWSILAAIVLFAIARNVPMQPVNPLAPHELNEGSQN